MREYQAGDERAIVDLFNDVFGLRRSIAHWRWKFEQNPYASPLITLEQEEQSGRLAAHYAVVPVRLNYLGLQVLGCQSVDTVVHPEFRGQALFVRTAEHCYRQCEEAGVELVYGFPNRRSQPGLLRRLAWKRVMFLEQYVYRLDVTRGAGNLLPPAAAGLASLPFRALRRGRLLVEGALERRHVRLRFEQASACPPQHDRLWDAVRGQEVLSLWKDRGYLAWRYEQNPDLGFEFFSAWDGERLVGLAVVALVEEEALIAELLVEEQRVEVGRALVGHVVRSFVGRARRVRFLGRDMGFFKEVFRGFAQEHNCVHVFALRALGGARSELALDALRPENWSLTLGDIDAF